VKRISVALIGPPGLPAPLRVLLSAASMIEQDGIEQGDYLRLFFGRDVLDEMCNGSFVKVLNICVGLFKLRHMGTWRAELATFAMLRAPSGAARS
jgi:hypothetical protein